jgi:DNA polymerase IV
LSSPIDPSVDEAPILHIDLDAFFASVEILDNPSLRGKPVAVGGAGERGVIASASYETRRYGIRSAMPSVVAKRLCPELIILPGRFDRYEQYSGRFHAIVADMTPVFEPLGLDEVFADLRSLRRLERRPLALASELRARIRDELGLRSGVGLGRNKLFAKLASKKSKPTVVNSQLVEGPGVVYVDAATEQRWLEELPVRSLWGVGPATAAKLERLGLSYVRDLRKVDESTLASHFGSALARVLVGYAAGEDAREVEPARTQKSIGCDQTYLQSLRGFDEVAEHLRHHAGVVARALRESGRTARTITVVVRYDDLTSVSRSQTLPFGLDDEIGICDIASALLASVSFDQAVRLLGIHASSFVAREENQVQLSFDVAGTTGDRRADAVASSRQRQVDAAALRDAIDEVRAKFGTRAVANASELAEDGIDVATRRGRSAFGPDQG